MTVMRSFKWSILCLVLLAGSGCSKNVRYLGGRIKNDIIRRGVSLSPGATEVVLGDTHVALEGRTASDDYPSTAKSVPVIMTGIKPNYEKIAQIRPDAVFYDPALFSQADLDKFKELKIKTFPIGGNNLDDFETSVYRVRARPTGSPSRVPLNPLPDMTPGDI